MNSVPVTRTALNVRAVRSAVTSEKFGDLMFSLAFGAVLIVLMFAVPVLVWTGNVTRPIDGADAGEHARRVLMQVDAAQTRHRQLTGNFTGNAEALIGHQPQLAAPLRRETVTITGGADADRWSARYSIGGDDADGKIASADDADAWFEIVAGSSGRAQRSCGGVFAEAYGCVRADQRPADQPRADEGGSAVWASVPQP